MSLRRSNEIGEFESMIRKAECDLREGLKRVEELKALKASEIRTGEMHAIAGELHQIFKSAGYPSLSFINRD